VTRQPLLNDATEEGQGIFGLGHGPDESLIHLIPVPFEATVSYGTGTVNGPRSILEASVQVDLLDGDHGRPYRFGICQQPEAERVRGWSKKARDGGTDTADAMGERLNAWLGSEVESLLDTGRVVGVIGGDHSVPFASIEAHARRCPGLGILHFDAHFDLRAAYEGFTWSHASVMRNVLERVPGVARIVSVGVRDYCEEEMSLVRASGGRIVPFLDTELRDAELQGRPFAAQAREMAQCLPQDVYVSFDIDGLDPALCPNTGTPVPGGLSFQQACAILNAVVSSGRRIVGFDLVEVTPGADDDQWNANVGARVLYKLIGATIRTRSVSLSAT